MKPFVRLGHVCRVFLTIGIVSLSILTAVATMSLSHTLAAQAHRVRPDPQTGNCPSGYYLDDDIPDNCLPNSQGLCGSGSTFDSSAGLCMAKEAIEGSCPPDFEATDTSTCVDGQLVACNPGDHISPYDGQNCIPDHWWDDGGL